MYQNSFEYFHRNRALTFDKINLIFRIVFKKGIAKNELLALKNFDKFNFDAINETSGVKKSIDYILMTCNML